MEERQSLSQLHFLLLQLDLLQNLRLSQRRFLFK